jgi:RNA polymerase sigma-70 factor (ECF subfamily)
MDPELKELLMRCKAEERSAQTSLYRRFAPQVFATAMRYTDSRETASDVAQESWVKVFKNLGKFTEFKSFEVGSAGSLSTPPSRITDGT